MSKTICFLLADGFEEAEAIVPADLLKRLGYNIILAGETSSVRGTHNFYINTTHHIDTISADKIDALVLPGGLPGTLNLRNNPKVINLVKETHRQHKICAAICAAPIILRDAGITKNISITGYPGCEQLSLTPNFKFSNHPIEITDNIITAIGMGKASKFAFAIAQKLGSTEQQITEIAQNTFISD